MLRRDPALAAGGFQARDGVVEDLELWVRILEVGTAICSPQVTIRYHLHSAQMSADWRRMLAAHRAVIEAHLLRAGGSSTALTRWEGVAAWDGFRAALSEGDRVEALRRIAPLMVSGAAVRGRLRLMTTRWHARRRVSACGRDGRPSVALVIDDAGQRAAAHALRRRKLRDLSEVGPARRLIELVRHPAGLVISDRTLWRALPGAWGWSRPRPTPRSGGEARAPEPVRSARRSRDVQPQGVRLQNRALPRDRRW